MNNNHKNRLTRLEQTQGQYGTHGGAVPSKRAYDEAAERNRARQSDIDLETSLEDAIAETDRWLARVGSPRDVSEHRKAQLDRYYAILEGDTEERWRRDGAVELAWLNARQHELSNEQMWRWAELLAEARGDEDPVKKREQQKQALRRYDLAISNCENRKERQDKWLKAADHSVLANRLRRLDRLEAANSSLFAI